MQKISTLSTWLNVFAFALLFGANAYQMTVIIPEFQRDLPGSVLRLSSGAIQPVVFWNSWWLHLCQLIPIAALVLNWNTPRRRNLAVAAGLMVFTIAITVTWFIPRLAIMGLTGGTPAPDTAALIAAANQFVIGDHLRMWLLVVPAFVFALAALSTPDGLTRPRT